LDGADDAPPMARHQGVNKEMTPKPFGLQVKAGNPVLTTRSMLGFSFL